MVACGWEEGAGECLLRGYQGSFWGDENVQLDSGVDAIVNVLCITDF